MIVLIDLHTGRSNVLRLYLDECLRIMGFESKSNLGLNPSLCMVCETPIVINPLKPGAPKLCGDVQCQTLYKQRSSMNPSLYEQHFDRQRKFILQKKHAEIEKQKHIERVKDAEFGENERIKDHLSQFHPLGAGRTIQVTQIPSGLTHAQSTDSIRIGEYTDHLNAVINEAQSADSLEELMDDQTLAAHESLLMQDERINGNTALSGEVARLCALCKGGCCSSGGNHAYIKAVTIRRLMDSLQVDGETLLSFYLVHVPEQAVVGSCINQTEKGCSLPKEYRSDVCNLYLCGEVERHLDWKEYDHSKNDLNLIVQRANNNWDRFETTEKNEVTRLLLIDEKGESEELALKDILNRI